MRTEIFASRFSWFCCAWSLSAQAVGIYIVWWNPETASRASVLFMLLFGMAFLPVSVLGTLLGLVGFVVNWVRAGGREMAARNRMLYLSAVVLLAGATAATLATVASLDSDAPPDNQTALIATGLVDAVLLVPFVLVRRSPRRNDTSQR